MNCVICGIEKIPISQIAKAAKIANFVKVANFTNYINITLAKNNCFEALVMDLKRAPSRSTDEIVFSKYRISINLKTYQPVFWPILSGFCNILIVTYC